MRDRSLTPILVADVISCAIFFVACVDFNQSVAELTGLPGGLVAIAGWICLAAAISFSVLVFRRIRALLGVATAANAAWVLASLVVLATYFGEMTAIGVALVIAQAVVIEFFVLREWQGFRHLASGYPATA